MIPDVVRAIEDLRARGILAEAASVLPLRAAKGELVSIHAELRAALYVGVLLVTTGAGLLVRQNLASIGPLGIALGLGAASALAFAWVVRRAPPFSWGEVPSPHLALDYILLLAVMLGAADLAYIEVKLTPLGAAWPWHLLLVSLVAGACAVRFDSRVVLTLALATFAAWRGVSVSYLEWIWWGAQAPVVRINMIACGALFAGLGVLMVRSRRKPHFEPVAVHLGALLVLGALASGVFERDDALAIEHSLPLLLAGGVLSVWAFRARRFSLFAMGVLGAYTGLSGILVRAVENAPAGVYFGWFLLSSLGVLAALSAGHAAMKRER